MKNTDFGYCPICCEGIILESSNAYVCSSTIKNSNQCEFLIPKSYYGKQISEKMALDLCTFRHTEVMDGFIKNGKQAAGSIKIGKRGIKMVWYKFPSTFKSTAFLRIWRPFRFWPARMINWTKIKAALLNFLFV